jgi:ubiquitin-like modifier-activating enzyme ATG7
MFGQAFDKCVACSSPIVEGYLANRQEFMIRACNEPDYLEELAGITAMMANINVDDIECFDVDEDMM